MKTFKHYQPFFIISIFSILSQIYFSKIIAQIPEKVGCVSGNCINGKGKYKSSDSTVYEGDFKEGKQDGFGTLTDSKGNSYKGEFKDNKFQGQGKYINKEGVIYEGEFVADKFEGQGVYTFANGDKYIGTFKKNKMHGFGKLIFTNGLVYIGNWEDNKRNGIGKLLNKKGEIEYKGEWLNDKMVHPEQSENYLSQVHDFFNTVINNKTFEGSQEIEMQGITFECGLTLQFELDMNDLRLYGKSIVKLKDDNKYLTKVAKFEGNINTIDKIITLYETDYLSKSDLPSPLVWTLDSYQLLINNDAGNKGHYILSNVPPKSNLYSSKKIFLVEKGSNKN